MYDVRHRLFQERQSPAAFVGGRQKSRSGTRQTQLKVVCVVSCVLIVFFVSCVLIVLVTFHNVVNVVIAVIPASRLHCCAEIVGRL